MKRVQHVLLLMLSVLASSALMAQGVTTSFLVGTAYDPAGEPLIGANITAIHEPTGSFYGASTDIDGTYRIPNMQVGGPYTLSCSYTGFGDKVLKGVYLELGKELRHDFNLADAAVELTGVEVVAKSGSSGANAGVSTQISSKTIENLPTVDRDLNDFYRLTPEASTAQGGGSISFAGINNRFNAVYIDGAVNNDVFGLAGSGTNGGQTGISPFSVDIIDQIQIVVSPYDVTLGGFAGGGINAVTKSGTNKFKGTAYYFLQNESLTGKTNGALVDRGEDDEKLAEYNVKQYGFSLGGPIIKNKLFFFGNVEIQDDETPAPFNVSEYRGDLTESDFTSLRSTLIDRYDYDPGNFGDKVNRLEGTKVFAKLNWNINNKHKLVLRHQYTKGESTSAPSSSNTAVRFENSGVFFPTITNSSALELNSRFNNKWANNLIVGYTKVDDDRDPINRDFPYVTIFDGVGSVQFGSEQFSTANALEQDVLSITNNLKHYAGDHTLTFGTHNEFYSIRNVFIRQNFGSYRYASLEDFLAGGAPSRYDRSYSLIDNSLGDNTNAASEFNASQLGFYVQDEWAASPRLTLTGGIRLDIPMIADDPNIHPTFNTETLPAIQALYPIANDVEGGQAPDPQLLWSPRLGFSYAIGEERSTTLTGGLGIFTSRVPFVWPGAMFSNNGVTVGGFSDRNGSVATEFRADPANQFTTEVAVPSGQVDLFTKDFKYPQVFRASLGLEKNLGNGLVASVDGLYTKTLNNVVYTNINSNPTLASTWEGSDNRPVYVGENIDDRYSSGIYLASNTDEGYTYNFTAKVQKNWESGLSGFIAYTFNDGEALNEGTSSQNSSQWRGQVSIDGRNNPVLGRSDFAVGSRIVSALSYDKRWGGTDNFTTSISLVYEGQSGVSYSYVLGGRGGQNVNNEEGSVTRNRSLIYVPRDQNDIVLVESGGMSPEEQWQLLNTFIEQDDHLSERRGQYAEKNGARAPWNNLWDLAIRQNVGTLIGETSHRLQLSFDIQNFANLLSKDWGVRYSSPGSNIYQLYQFQGLNDNGVPTFSYTDERLGDERYNIADRGSRWRLRVGIRYLF